MHAFEVLRDPVRRRILELLADETPLREVDQWLDRFRAFWEPKFEALATEISRGKRKWRPEGGDSS